MRCQIRENLEHARKSVDRMAYDYSLGSAEFDRWLAESNELGKAIDAHTAMCPLCALAARNSMVA
jgi:hypothetical protein